MKDNFFTNHPYQEPRSTKDKQKELDLHQRLVSIIRAISGKLKLEVVTDIDEATRRSMMRQGQDPDQTWFAQAQVDPVTKEVVREWVHIPASITESTENVAKGKAAHEAGHVAITRFGRFIPDEVMQEIGFHSAIAAAEERATDQVVRDRFDGAGLWVDEARQDSVREASMAIKSQEKMGYIPKFAQLCDLIVYAPHFEEQPTHCDEDVLKLYEKIRPEIEKLEHTIPEDGDSEEVVMQKAKERYRIVYKKIWPLIKELVKDAEDQEALRNMIDQMLKGDSESSKEGEPGGQEKPINLDDLPEDLRQELEKKIKEAQEKQRASERGGDQSGEKSEDAQAQAGEKKEDGQSQAQDGEQASDQIQEDGQTPKQSTDGQGQQGRKKVVKPGETGEQVKDSNPSEDDGTPVPMDQLSPELLKQLKKILESLSPEQQQALKQKAKDTLSKLEDDAVKSMSGKLDEQPAETHQEREDRLDQERRDAARSKILQEMEALEDRVEAVESQVGHYDRVYREIQEIDEELYQTLEAIFNPNLKRAIKLKSSGPRINLKSVFRWEVDRAVGNPSMDNRIFETTQTPEKRDYVFTILVDLSGSMSHSSKIENTFKGVVLLAEVLARLGIKIEILGFQDKVIKFKDFDEEMTDAVRSRMSGMVDEVSGTNPGGNNVPSYNDDGPSLTEASKSLAKQVSKNKFLLVLSDGMPEGRFSNAQDLHEAVRFIMENTDQKLLGVGLGYGTEHVKEFYPTSLPSVDLKKLPETLGAMLEDMIVNPQKYGQQAKD